MDSWQSYQLIIPTPSIQIIWYYVAGIMLLKFYIQLYKSGIILMHDFLSN